MRTNLYFLVPSIIPCGPITVVINIIKGLNKQKFNPIIIALSINKNFSKDLCYKFLEPLDVEIVFYDYSKFYMFFNIKKISKVLEEKYNAENVIFHAHGYFPTLIISNFKKIKTITTIHNICDEDFKFNHGIFLGSLMAFYYKRSLKSIDQSIAISKTVRSKYNYYSQSLDVIYNAVDFSCYKNNESLKVNLREDYHIPADSKVFIYPANFQSLKNHQFLINSLKKLKRRDFCIIFTGDGKTKKKCIAHAGKDSRFIFVKHQKNLEPYWDLSDYLISSSKSEGMALIVAEALIHRKVCFLSSIPAFRELKEHFEDILIFSIQDEDDICSKINLLLDEKKELSIENHDIARNMFSIKSMAREYEKKYFLILRLEKNKN